MRTGLSLSTANWTMVRKFSSRRLPPTFPGLMRYLASARAQSGYLREQQMAVVVEIADDRNDDAGVDDAPRRSREPPPPLRRC